jgi:hypothetical protein
MGFFYEDSVDQCYWDYEALSYTWGSAVEGVEEEKRLCGWEILILTGVRYLMQNDELSSGKEGVLSSVQSVSAISIGSNLSDYLGSMITKVAAKNQPLSLNFWIDAICIDQTNPEEKKAQIPLMGEIYANAETVNVWLGSDRLNWDTFEWMHATVYPALVDLYELYESRHERDAFMTIMSDYAPTEPYFWNKYHPSIQLPEDLSWEDCWRAYWLFFYQRRWFKRAWTFQEAVLAEKISAFCGSNFKELPFSSIGNLAILIQA